MVHDCPRCDRTNIDQPYYGPCGPCRDELRALWANTKKHVERPEFEPAQVATPNFVATKD